MGPAGHLSFNPNAHESASEVQGLPSLQMVTSGAGPRATVLQVWANEYHHMLVGKVENISSIKLHLHFETVMGSLSRHNEIHGRRP